MIESIAKIKIQEEENIKIIMRLIKMIKEINMILGIRKEKVDLEIMIKIKEKIIMIKKKNIKRKNIKEEDMIVRVVIANHIHLLL